MLGKIVTSAPEVIERNSTQDGRCSVQRFYRSLDETVDDQCEGTGDEVNPFATHAASGLGRNRHTRHCLGRLAGNALCSRAGAYLTGTVIPLDGGSTGCN